MQFTSLDDFIAVDNQIRIIDAFVEELMAKRELRWLTQQLVPNYHTISDLRKNHPEPLKNHFKRYVYFLDELNLLGKQTIGVDGSKFNTCLLKNNCTKLNKRIIQRTQYQDAVEKNNENIRQNPDYYKKRQSICEHPFGTIKRQWGYTYTLVKGLQKVNGKMNLIMLAYNIRRTISLLGIAKLETRLKKSFVPL